MTESRDVGLRWRASPLTLAIATCAGVALAVAVIASRWELIAFAAPLLGVLGSIGWQPAVPVVRVHCEPSVQRCFEAEKVRLNVWVTTESKAATLAFTVSSASGMRLEVADSASPQRQAVTAVAGRWGRFPIRVQIDAVGRGGLVAGTATVDAAEVIVFPLAPPQPTPTPQTELLERLGTHLTRRIGPGVEYADIRPYVSGDQLRSINWPVSARRAKLHVTQRQSEHAADVVVLIDTYPQAPGPATLATERVARGAAQVVQTALRNGDRAGIVALGGRHPRWLGPDLGRRQFYRVLDTVLGAGGVSETTTGTLAPRAAVPPGAIVVAFSTLLETEFALALIDLRKRGHVVVAVDVLGRSPFAEPHDPLIDRMWQLQRSAMYRDMATIGVDVVAWRDDRALEQAMRLVPERRRRLRGRR
ncbi:DUF58 domain-containing protein [Mycobacterium sp. SM1]|uniref:DUF58 domain-containing protein n=1 Tax=Mycobacterium sp. SM1 TaxID=2816243 RepID=UPI001BCC68EB|nr:DUF58 domain-containing protein [Mycobacterium sp. SM1]MBS4727395.1 DUF58 domain-containing protein [Mycobacterium sp. SM1]